MKIITFIYKFKQKYNYALRNCYHRELQILRVKYAISHKIFSLVKTNDEKFTSRDPSINGRIALIKLKRSWFFKFLRSSSSVQLCSSHIAILQQEYYYTIKMQSKLLHC